MQSGPWSIGWMAADGLWRAAHLTSRLDDSVVVVYR